MDTSQTGPGSARGRRGGQPLQSKRRKSQPRQGKKSSAMSATSVRVRVTAKDVLAAADNEHRSSLLRELKRGALQSLIASAKYNIGVLKAVYDELQRRMGIARALPPLQQRHAEQGVQSLLDQVCRSIEEHRARERKKERKGVASPLPGPSGRPEYRREYDDLVAKFSNLLKLVMMPANTPEAEESRRRSEAELNRMGAEFAAWATRYPHKQFPWPSTFSSGEGGAAVIDRADVSPLTALGYRVGKTAGLRDAERRRLLTWAFRNALPPVISHGYMASWGPPSTVKRLQKMANHIAHVGKHRRKFSGDQDTAVRQWQADLDYLERQFYKGVFGFEWPSTRGQ
ncbi:hypothetical protein [Sandarakinorhabdus cyanobacteriorum]|uniref:hypothetical protein n=1 Tax=Sandarakinorhabdus cyanobacteriorum TaxID=1981098 RepID=UPI0013FD82A3|nr:hypothetical protein [Sandarakinorhabdus cyanobacteriorum]